MTGRSNDKRPYPSAQDEPMEVEGGKDEEELNLLQSHTWLSSGPTLVQNSGYRGPICEFLRSHFSTTSMHCGPGLRNDQGEVCSRFVFEAWRP